MLEGDTGDSIRNETNLTQRPLSTTIVVFECRSISDLRLQGDCQAYMPDTKYLPGCPIKVVVELLFYVHGKHLRSCWDGQLT